MDKKEQKTIIRINFVDEPPSGNRGVDWDKIIKNSEKVAYIFEREDENSRRIQSQGCPA